MFSIFIKDLELILIIIKLMILTRTRTKYYKRNKIKPKLLKLFIQIDLKKTMKLSSGGLTTFGPEYRKIFSLRLFKILTSYSDSA